ncbi:MAG: hypothetical protein CUN55_02045 [Phototrophicales bacterium]|nr:MAG: hypothetical protein CUN55_02045 [Phototrophicales bacterium]
MKRWLTLLIGPMISVVIIYVLIGDDIDAVHVELMRARYIYLLPTALLLIFSLMTRAMRWRVLLDERISWWHAFHILNVGYFLSGVLPLRVGDLARAWMVTRLDTPIPAFKAISTIIIERLLDVLALVAMIGLMLVLLDVPSQLTTLGVIVGVAALSGGLLLAWAAMRPEWLLKAVAWLEGRFMRLKSFDLETRLVHFLDGIKPMGNPAIAFGALFWSGMSWLLSLAAGYVLLFFLFDEPTFAATVSLIVLATSSVALPAVPGNLGPFEGAVVGGLLIGGMINSATPPENAPAVATGVVLHALTLGIYTTLGIIGLMVEHASVKQITSATRDFSSEPAMLESAS